MCKNNKIIIFSGGTGGHVIPAINYANYLNKSGYECTLILDKRGDKYAKNFKGKKFVIFSSHLSGNIFFQIRGILKLILGFFQSIVLILKLKPQNCISFGSYATLAPIFTLLFFKIFFKTKLYLHEQNSIIGKVNLFFLYFAENIFLNFKKTYNLNDKYYPKAIFVGMPSTPKKEKILIDENKLNNKTVFVYGGSQGAVKIINNLLLMINLLDEKILKNIKFIIQCPKNISKKIEKTFLDKKINYIISDFYHNIDEILSQTDLALTRAGAGTINNLIKYNIPSLIFPLNNSINDHQYYNAKFLVENDSAILLKDSDKEADTNAKIFNEIITNDKKIKIMKKSLKKIFLLEANEIMLKKMFYDKK